MPHTWTAHDIRRTFGYFKFPSDADELFQAVYQAKEGPLLERLDGILETNIELVGQSILAREIGVDDQLWLEELDRQTNERLRIELRVFIDDYIWHEQRRRRERLTHAEARALWRRRCERDRKWLVAALIVLLWMLYFRSELMVEGRFAESREPDEDGGCEADDMLPRPRPPGSGDDDGFSGPGGS